jgi:hypothetical protein
VELTNIGSYEQDSIITAYGTDGTNLFQLFAQPDNTLLKILSTKYIRGQQLDQLTIKNWKRLFLDFSDNDGSGVNFVGGFSTRGGGIPTGTQEVSFNIATAPVLGTGVTNTPRPTSTEPYPLQASGISGAVDIQSISKDFTIERLHVMLEGRTLWGA